MAVIGTLVISSQTAELMLGQILTFVLQDGTPLTYSRIMELDAKHRKQTLGSFIREMKKRAEFDASIEDTLDRFLENRNKLVHRFNEVPGHELSTPDEISAMSEFLDQFCRDLMAVFLFTGALLHAWTEQSGVAKGIIDGFITDDSRDLITRVKALAPRVGKLVFAKSDEYEPPKGAPAPGRHSGPAGQVAK